MKDQLRLIRVSIPKSPVPIAKCDMCKGGRADQKRHIHLEDLDQPFKGFYYQVKANRRKFYETVLKSVMKKRWFDERLEPLDVGGGCDTAFHDGEKVFEAVSLCREKSALAKKFFSAFQSKITPEQARDLLVKQINENWQFTPQDGQ